MSIHTRRELSSLLRTRKHSTTSVRSSAGVDATTTTTRRAVHRALCCGMALHVFERPVSPPIAGIGETHAHVSLGRCITPFHQEAIAAVNSRLFLLCYLSLLILVFFRHSSYLEYFVTKEVLLFPNFRSRFTIIAGTPSPSPLLMNLPSQRVNKDTDTTPCRSEKVWLVDALP